MRAFLLSVCTFIFLTIVSVLQTGIEDLMLHASLLPEPDTAPGVLSYAMSQSTLQQSLSMLQPEQVLVVEMWPWGEVRPPARCGGVSQECLLGLCFHTSPSHGCEQQRGPCWRHPSARGDNVMLPKMNTDLQRPS